MARLPIGVQLYSVRHDFANDARGTLKAVAEMGYEGVEFAGDPPIGKEGAAEELKGYLDEFGLKCCGWHTPYHRVADDQIDDTIAFNKTLDNKYVIVPGIPGNLRQSRDDWLKLAVQFNQVADRLAEEGMVTGYHNHSVEFQPLDGELPWETFFSATNKGVAMQLDIGNAMSGGGDVVKTLSDYPGRALTVHLKPYSPSLAEKEGHGAAFRPVIGQDEAPWDEVFRLCESTAGTEWYIVEYESNAYPPLEAVERCLKALKEMGK